MRAKSCLLVATALVALGDRANADATGKVYRDQLLDLHKKVTDLLSRVEKADWRDQQLRLEEHKEAFALTKLIHRLGEEAQRTDLEQEQDGADTDKVLVGVDLGASALDFTLKATVVYITTGDKSFLRRAHDGDAMARTVEKML